MALYQPRSVEEYETLLSDNMDELERISRMVENILFLARAGEAQSALNYSRLDVAAELRRVADYFEGLAEERGIALSCEGEGELKADAMLFQRALSNLVANAVRYADENSLIVLRAERRADAWWVQVINQAADRAGTAGKTVRSFLPRRSRAQRRQPRQRPRAVYRTRHHDAARR